jgi:hypothetical protein
LSFALHYERSALLDASVEQSFAYLDDFKALSAHMEKRSAMMAGSTMRIAMDELGGRAVGSRILMEGRVLGLALRLEEVVTERNPPLRKAWQTIEANLLVVGPYRLGFELSGRAQRSGLRVFIDYELPPAGPGRWLGRFLAGRYARWCVDRMVQDAVSQLGQQVPAPGVVRKT